MLDLQSEQHAAGQPYLDLYEAVVDLKRRHDLHPCAVRPRDGLSLRKESERELVHELVRRFRNLPVDQQRKLPALLNSLAQLEVVVGELEAGQQDFQEVTRLVSDPISQAEAHHNVYRAALERGDWNEALAALLRRRRSRRPLRAIPPAAGSSRSASWGPAASESPSCARTASRASPW